MKTKRTTLIVAGAILMLLSGQVLAQPWGAGAGRGRGMARGQGWGRGGAQRGPGACCPLGAGPAGQGAWCPLGLGRLGLNRLGLTDDQVQKIRGILDKARSEALASIKEVLTEEQARQFEQMRSGAAQPGRGIGGPALQGGPGGPVGPRFQQGMGQGGQMRPRGQRLSGQPAGEGRGTGRGQRSQRGMNRPETVPMPPADQGNPVPGQVRDRNLPLIERMFDRADTDQNGALTREEIRAFHEGMGRSQ